MLSSFSLKAFRRFAMAAAAFAVQAVEANVSAPMFQSNMVIQRRMAAPVFGTAASGEAVTVTFRGQTKTATAGSNGRWQVKLDATEAGGPFQMVIKGNNTLTLDNVMVGEVWLCGGQSNMEWTLNMIGGVNKDSAAVADFPNIRVITMQFGRNQWKALTPEVALHFSATGYYFGKDLHKALNIPIGLISSSVGGTAVERWLDPVAIAADTGLAKDTTAGNLYDAWIAPVKPYGIRGAIWYQGESNANVATGRFYRSRFAALINGWRRVWAQGDFPFYFVQLANYTALQTDPGEDSRWAEIREAQRLSLSLPNTAMAVAIDVGEAADIHPKNKWDLGKRLALPAKHLVYGRAQDSAYSGPLFDTCERKGSLVRIRFDHAHGGLVDKGTGGLKGFALAGTDGKWHWAAAAIRKDTVLVSSTSVANPVKVRYAWANNPLAAPLYNGVSLPASPFQADVPKEVPVSIVVREFYPGGAIPRRAVPGGAGSDALGRAPGEGRAKAALKRFPIP
jgi:sialate O-acetylesterase